MNENATLATIAESEPITSPMVDGRQPKESESEKPRLRGFGYLYKRGKVWWIRYSVRGRDFRESSGSEKDTDAMRLLKRRWKEVGKGRFIGPSEDRVTMDDLLDAVKVDYQNNKLRSLPDLEGRLRHLREAFGGMRAIDVTEDRIERYKQTRLSEKSRQGNKPVQPGTVNRELAALRRAFHLGVRQKRIAAAPVFAMLEENAAREGFVEPKDFEVILSGLPEHIQDFSRFAYITGCRKGELQTMTWADVKQETRMIEIRRENTKNKEPHRIPLEDELAAIIERRWQARAIHRADGSTGLAKYVFHCGDGRPIGDIRKAWATACVAAQMGEMVCDTCKQSMTTHRCPRCKIETKYLGTLFHDLRRSAVRNLDRDGVTQSVAMKITGHKTASVYRRYRIVSEDDMREALKKVQRGIEERKSQPRVVQMIGAASR